MGMSTVAQAGPRRAPVQERSQETVARIQAAAGRLLARGVAAPGMTTAQIAAEAGLSVGGLYRFFPDKQAVIDAIAVAHLERFQEGLAGALMAALPETPEGFLGAVVDAFAAYLEANADFRTLAYGTPEGGGRAISRALFERQLGAGGAGDMAAMVREFMVEMFAIAPDGDFDFRLRIAAEIGDRLIGHAFGCEGAARQRVLSEAKDLIVYCLFARKPAAVG
jgi:AcrR family transcriptional regulator